MAGAQEGGARRFVEDEAEESGEDADLGDLFGDEEEDAADTGADLAGFVVPDGPVEGGDAAGGGAGGSSASRARPATDSSSSDGEEPAGAQKLNAEDLAVLADAGIDTSKLPEVERRRAAEGAAEGEPPTSRPRVEPPEAGVAAHDKDDLFGDGDDHEDLFGPLDGHGSEHRNVPKDLDEMSMGGDSVDSFIVEDHGAAKRRKRANEAAELEVSEEQLQEIIDIFGDSSVLRPIDEREIEADAAKQADCPTPLGSAAAETPPPGSVIRSAAPASTKPSSDRVGSALDSSAPAPGSTLAGRESAKRDPGQEAQGVLLPLPEEDTQLDPDLKDKLYESKRDFMLEVIDMPERWYQAYHSEPALLDPRDGGRRWTDEEHDCEARWIYMEAFWDQTSYDQEQCERCVKKMLVMLHVQQLEPIHIIAQHGWRFMKAFYEKDLQTIFHLDRRWQSCWLLYKQLVGWVGLCGDSIPSHIKAKVDRNIWEEKGAELVLKDLYDWFAVMRPMSSSQEEVGPKQLHTADSEKMAAVRQNKFDEKLGIIQSTEEMTLKAFGITPHELGTNIECNKQVYAPKGDEDDEISHKIVCQRHMDQSGGSNAFTTENSVMEALTFYISRLIASEPRVRKFVRTKFMDMCAVSTTPTESGKPVVYEAAQSFRPSYRAMHLVNRPISTFYEGDVLWLDVLRLEQQGFLNVEYSLIQQDVKSETHKYKFVMLGHDSSDIPNDRSRLTEHFRKQQGGEAFWRDLPEDKEAEELKAWNWGAYIKPRLEAVAKSHEVEHRRKSVAGGEALDKAQALFNCATMEFTFDNLNQFMDPDPIYEALQKFYCYVELEGGTEVFVVRTDWNWVRKKILLRALRDELYPMLWNEVRMKLSSDAEMEVCKQCVASLTKIIDVQPYRLRPETLQQQKEENKMNKAENIDEMNEYVSDSDSDDDQVWQRDKRNRLNGSSSVLSIVPDVSCSTLGFNAGQPGDTCCCALVNGFGEPVDVRMLFKSFYKTKSPRMAPPEPGSHMAMMEQKREEHRETFKKLLVTHKPAIILLPVCDKDVTIMREHIKAMIDSRELSEHFKVKPYIVLGDVSVPRVVAYHPRIMEEGVYRDLTSPLQRIAISCARFLQDPLAETAQLWHELPDENHLPRLHLHRLQDAVPRDTLQRALLTPIMESVLKAGVNVNRLRRSPHLCSVVPFVPGLGPRKARLFRKCLNDNVTSRSELAARFVKHLRRSPDEDPSTSSVVTNFMPFVKICPDLRDAWEIEQVAGLDRTRLGESFRPWIQALCQKAIQAQGPFQEDSDDEGLRPNWSDKSTKDYLADAIAINSKDQSMEKTLGEMPLEDWHVLAGLPNFFLDDEGDDADLDILLNTHLMPEILEPHKDLRQEFTDMDDSQAFYLLIGDTEDQFNCGTLVHCTVMKDTEFEGAGASSSPRLDVRVTLIPSLMRGSFKKNNKEAGYIKNCNREFIKGETCIARVINIRASKDFPYSVTLSVDPDADMWAERFPISNHDATYFVPHDGENWTKEQLGVSDASEGQRKAKLKDWVRRPRNIRHTNWCDADHARALKIIADMPMGNVLFRPSRRHDIIIGMLKVRETRESDSKAPYAVDKHECFRVFDILENMKEKNNCEGLRNLAGAQHRWHGVQGL